MDELLRRSYDEVPYQGGPFRRSQPRHLATLATLLGLSPPNVDCCRVLELGCAEGGNLIPLAAANPGCSYLGIDFSDRQIAIGRKTIDQLGLSNIELRHADILQVDPSYGTFDYVIAHGIYSWVPEHVRDKVLKICRENLSPEGIAYVSFNTYPGGRMRQMVRDMMLYRVRDLPGASESVAEARSLLNFLVESIPENQPTYRAVLEWERRHIEPFADHHVRHDSLSEVNDPCYFWQFVEHANRHGMQYLADANFSTMLPRSFPPEVFARLKQMSRSIVEIEQYMDFLRNRSFRETLLCPAEVKIDRAVSPAKVRRFYVGSSLRPAEAVDFSSNREEVFRNPDGGEVKVGRPLSKAALLELERIWPSNVSFEQVIEMARQRLGADCPSAGNTTTADIDGVASALLECFAAGLIELDVRPTRCADGSADRPMVTALNRLEASRGETITNQRHEQIRLDAMQRALVPHLDGRLGKPELFARATQSMAATAMESRRWEAALQALAGAAILIDASQPNDSTIR